jgi:hypothetical protein
MGRKRDDSQAASDSRVETLAEVVKDLRTSVHETQAVFAEHFAVARTYIANVEGDTSHPTQFVEELIKRFPKQETRIRNAFENSLKNRPHKVSRRRPIPPRHRQIENYLHTGRFSYARRQLVLDLNRAGDDQERQWILERLHAALVGLGEQDAALGALQGAIDAAVSAGLTDKELVCRVRLANSYQIPGSFHLAHEVLDTGLARYPDAARLWLRKGIVHWYEQAYGPAYASLTTALKYGSPRQSVLHARSQVLAEWGSFSAALDDISAYLKGEARDPVSNPIAVASVRSAQAYIWALTDKYTQALAEFAAITPANPDSAWLYYRRALCHVHVENNEAAVSDLRRAIAKQSPKLNPPRYAHAVSLLDSYGVALETETGTS